MLPRTSRRPKRPSVTASGGPVAPEASFVDRKTQRSRVGARAGRSTIFPRRRPSVPVRRAAFAALIFASLALITVSYQDGGRPSGVQLVVLEAVSPIERGLSRAWDPIASAWDWTGRVFTAANENPELKAENAELRQRLRFASEQEDQLLKARRALAFDETFTFDGSSRYESVWAEVSVRQPGAIEHSIVVNRGSNQGVQVDDPVMGTGGLLGKVIEVTPNNAIIGLMLDGTLPVSAAVTGSEAWGVLKTVSTEGTPTMQLNFVKQSADVDVDDLVVTSGFASKNGELRSVYPKGLPIGIVTNVGNDPADTKKTVQVTPFADFDRIDEVMILTERSGSAG